MNKGIKIGLIAFAALILIAVVVLSIKGLSGGGDTIIASTPFEKKVQERVEKEITDKDYAAAQSGFNSIMSFVDTETTITLANGQKNVNPEEAANVRAMVFGAYAPIVINRANQIFNGSVWTDADVNAIESEAKRLRGFNVGSTDLTTQLDNIQRIAADYRAAWQVANSAKSCSSVDNIATLSAKADGFKKAPLSNCKSLVQALESVPGNARAAVQSSLYSKAVNIYNKRCGYGSYSSLESAVNTTRAGINSYITKYGGTDKTSSALGYLNSALSEGYDCYYNYYNNYEDDYYYY